MIFRSGDSFCFSLWRRREADCRASLLQACGRARDCERVHGRSGLLQAMTFGPPGERRETGGFVSNHRELAVPTFLFRAPYERSTARLSPAADAAVCRCRLLLPAAACCCCLLMPAATAMFDAFGLLLSLMSASGGLSVLKAERRFNSILRLSYPVTA